MRAELLPPLSTGRALSGADRHLHFSPRFSLHRPAVVTIVNEDGEDDTPEHRSPTVESNSSARWTERIYGIPPEHVIGSSIKTRFEVRNGRSILLRLPELEFLDDKEGKPVAIHRFVGRRPILAVGNSDGDLPMLQWTAAGRGARLMVLVHHTDGRREFEYDRQSAIGRLDKALDEAIAKRWTVVSMKDDWKAVFAQ